MCVIIIAALLVSVDAAVPWRHSATMTTKQSRHYRRKLSEGYRQVTLMLPRQALAELDRRAGNQGITRLEVVRRWLLGENDIIEK